MTRSSRAVSVAGCLAKKTLVIRKRSGAPPNVYELHAAEQHTTSWRVRIRNRIIAAYPPANIYWLFTRSTRVFVNKKYPPTTYVYRKLAFYVYSIFRPSFFRISHRRILSYLVKARVSTAFTRTRVYLNGVSAAAAYTNYLSVSIKYYLVFFILRSRRK